MITAKFYGRARVLTLSALLIPSFVIPVNAQGTDELEFSANVALTTNYVFRGISQTDDGPAISGGFDAGIDMFYAGVWGSSVDFGDATTMELDIYAGISPEYEGITFDFGVLYYGYPDSPELATGSQDFVEIYGGASRDFNMVSLGVSLAYSPDCYGETGGAYYLKGDLGFQVAENVSISGHYGYSSFEDNLLNDDYSDYSAGVTVSALGLDFDVRYYGTANMVGGNSDAVVLTVSKEF